MVLNQVAADITALGDVLKADVLAWGYAAVAVVLVASVVLWVKRFLA